MNNTHWFGISKGDVGEPIELATYEGELIMDQDQDVVAEMAKVIARQAAAPFRVIKFSEVARIAPKALVGDPGSVT